MFVNEMKLYKKILETIEQRKKIFAVLIDPDKQNMSSLMEIIRLSNQGNVGLILIGGSLISKNNIEEFILSIKQHSKIPVLIFPGNTMQLNNKADGILLLSLISGRNPEMLIGNHVLAAPFLKKSNLEIIPTGYMLIESGKATSASYISNTVPIPYDKNDIATATAIAGEMLGLKMIYMDAGSGARKTISNEMIKSVSKNIEIPLIVGGGITSAEEVQEKFAAGADIIVMGNEIEKEPVLITKILKH
ncbi:MAG: geranylgeranylglyceryl/heptaprenylglyceryl phosphate synthase [Flavobacteriales bacterium]|nr:geranylgeranylglyceryl/heptaprenylglyceryl phosphate synthase [Flavobacteriales bacterium]|tara:strand:- start:353 stop:1093 length:741 start_codon:yes stop_codon:yes gene_type:complete